MVISLKTSAVYFKLRVSYTHKLVDKKSRRENLRDFEMVKHPKINGHRHHARLVLMELFAE